jgi:hypothetical protein
MADKGDVGLNHIPILYAAKTLLAIRFDVVA